MKDSGNNGNSPASAFRWGIYEKALPPHLSWAERLSVSADARRWLAEKLNKAFCAESVS